MLKSLILALLILFQFTALSAPESLDSLDDVEEEFFSNPPPDEEDGGIEFMDELPATEDPAVNKDAAQEEKSDGFWFFGGEDKDQEIVEEREFGEAIQPDESEQVQPVEVIWKNQMPTKKTYIKHPNAKKGLIRITSEKKYIYRVPRSPQKGAFSFRFGMFDPSKLANPETGATIEQSYDSSSGPIGFFEYEWQWFQGTLGKLGLKVGTGVFTAQGNGQFKNNYDINQGKSVPKEQFTLVALPNSVGAIYRMDIFSNQWIIPYADGGVMGITFAEFRDDKDAPKVGLGLAGFFSGGVAIDLGIFSPRSVLELDRNYGINDVYLVGEFRQLVNLGSDFNFESTAINGGFLMEF